MSVILAAAVQALAGVAAAFGTKRAREEEEAHGDSTTQVSVTNLDIHEDASIATDCCREPVRRPAPASREEDFIRKARDVVSQAAAILSVISISYQDATIMYGLAAVTNVVLTTLTAGRILWMRRAASHVPVDKTLRLRYNTAIRLILESGVIYCIGAIVMLIASLGAAENTSVGATQSVILMAIAQPLLNIVPTFTLVYVGRNATDTSEDRPIRSSSIATSAPAALYAEYKALCAVIDQSEARVFDHIVRAHYQIDLAISLGSALSPAAINGLCELPPAENEMLGNLHCEYVPVSEQDGSAGSFTSSESSICPAPSMLGQPTPAFILPAWPPLPYTAPPPIGARPRYFRAPYPDLSLPRPRPPPPPAQLFSRAGGGGRSDQPRYLPSTDYTTYTRPVAHAFVSHGSGQYPQAWRRGAPATVSHHSPRHGRPMPYAPIPEEREYEHTYDLPGRL
ncbi:hypothetical protein GGX14DRAFT_562384 [Mycena pura]|uniref:Transmembrane protein n=1 Tax=Mycena pura TaxID=153505 RepID=A0AAD6YIF5_9AGAR|nr:hypothetical protein GGX14DRAFT_562384 [Mycena pura]